MTGFFSTNRARKAIRRQAHYKPMFSYDAATNTTTRVTKRDIEKQTLGFTGYSLKYGDVMIVYDVDDILQEYKLETPNSITNNYFENVRVDKLGVMYLPKLKKFAYLALNENFEMYILFKADSIEELPNGDNINIENLHSTAVILEQANTRILSVYKYIHDLSVGNPLILYKVSEVFKR